MGASGESQANVLSPGIVGLFIQGIGIGMVFSQLATWLSLPRGTGHRFTTVLTVFITTTGLIQTAIYFLSSWRIYVAHYGEPIIPTWTERIHIILVCSPSGIIDFTSISSSDSARIDSRSVVVALALLSCGLSLHPTVLLMTYADQILKRNMYFIMPLLLILLSAVALSIFETVWLFQGMYDGKNTRGSHAFWSLLLYTSLPLLLDITLSSIMFYHLTQSRERVYADHAVQWISRLIVIVWQSGIPPTICAIGIFIVYLVSHRLYPGEKQMWYPTLQAIIGNLYVLSYFYNINTHPLFVSDHEQAPTLVVTLTVPALHAMSTSVLNAPEEHPSEPCTDSLGRTDGGTARYYGPDSKTTSPQNYKQMT